MNKFSNFLKQHQSEIILGLSIAGYMGAIVTAVTATPKAVKLIEERKKYEKVDDISALEKIRTVWKLYTPTALLAILSTAGVICANRAQVKHVTALTAAYSLSEEALHKYEQKVVEDFGKNKDKKVRSEIAQDEVNANPVSTNTVLVTGKGKTLCYDPSSGRYFESDIDTIKRAVNELNRRMVTNEMYISLNELYSEIGLPPTSVGYELGWNVNKGFIEIDFSSVLSEDGQPCLCLDLRTRPIPNYTQT